MSEIKGKLKSFYELCRVNPRIPSLTINVLSKAADSEGMLDLRRTSLSQVYVHPASCTTVPEEAFEYFVETSEDTKDTEDCESSYIESESHQGTLVVPPSLTTPESFQGLLEAYGVSSGGTAESSNFNVSNYISGIQKASVKLDDTLNSLYIHSEPLESVLSSDPSLTTNEDIKEPSECSESALNTIQEDGLTLVPKDVAIAALLISTDEEPLVMTKSLFTKSTKLRHRTHYIKLTLIDPNLSFRYFYESEDNKHQEGFWWLKDHINKASIKIDEDFIRKHYEDIIEMHEIIGRYLHKKGYRKIVKNLRTNELVEVKDM